MPISRLRQQKMQRKKNASQNTGNFFIIALRQRPQTRVFLSKRLEKGDMIHLTIAFMRKHTLAIRYLLRVHVMEQ